MSNYTIPVNGSVPSNVPIDFVTDSGTATSAANAINIVGSGGISTSGSGSTVTISGTTSVMTWVDQGTSTTASANTGYFLTAGITLTLPSPSQGNVVVVEVETGSACTVQAGATEYLSISGQTSVINGTAVSTGTGDSLYLVYRNSSSTWHSISVEGTWTVT